MGRKVSDGKTFNFTVPAGGPYADGELMRVGGLNGCIVNPVAVADTERIRAAEAASDFIHSILVPSGINPAVGTFLYWATPASTQYGPTHLQTTPATAGDAPCFFVTGAKNAANYLRGRVVNSDSGK